MTGHKGLSVVNVSIWYVWTPVFFVKSSNWDVSCSGEGSITYTVVEHITLRLTRAVVDAPPFAIIVNVMLYP